MRTTVNVETLQGTGTAITKDGNVPVRFNLKIQEQQISVRSHSHTNATVAGRKSITGWIRPFCGAWGETLVLEMDDDNRKVTFTFSNSDGLVTGSNMS
jgi:hypothetical protein